MFDRFFVGSLLIASLALSITGCTKPSGLDSITVTPATSSLIVGGAPEQLTATGKYGNAKSSTSQDITSQVAWTSSSPGVASINKVGIVTPVGTGSAIITASAQGFNGPVTASATITVTGSGGGTGGGGGTTSTEIVSIAIYPGAQSVTSPNETGQFIAIGTTSTGATVNLTTLATWASSSVQIATVGSPEQPGTTPGLAKGLSTGTTTITALYTNADKTTATGVATFTVSGGTTEAVTALTIIPGTQAATAQTQQSQFVAIGTSGSTGLQLDETTSTSLQWNSSNLAVATINSSGIATAQGAGETTIRATWTNADGSIVTATATYSVTLGAAQEPLLSINIVPGGVIVSNRGMTAQYLAFGTFSTAPTVQDITNGFVHTGFTGKAPTQWISTLPEVASINSGGVVGEMGGLATSQGYTGDSVLYAEATNPDGTAVLSNSQTFTCKDPNAQVCVQDITHPQLATLTVYNAGENTTTWLVTAPSDTNTPNLIHCGPGSTSGGSVCTGTYETGSTVVLTESPTGAGFGGWSSGDGVAGGVGCQPAAGTTLATSPTCTVTLNGDTSVGAIFY